MRPSGIFSGKGRKNAGRKGPGAEKNAKKRIKNCGRNFFLPQSCFRFFVAQSTQPHCSFALAWPCSAAIFSHFMASSRSASMPSPFRYIMPHRYWASGWPCMAATR